mgnify:CR=1 FL=1
MVTKKYEAMMVFSVVSGDEATAALAEKFKALIAEHGTVLHIRSTTKLKAIML